MHVIKKLRINIASLSIMALSFSCTEEQIDIAPIEIGLEQVEINKPTAKSSAELGLVNVEQQRQLRNNNTKSKPTEKED